MIKIVFGLLVVVVFALFTDAGYLDRNNLTKKIGMCPPPKTLKGNCTFDTTHNCLTDSACPENNKCCREGCNKICKPIAPLPKEFKVPDFGIFNKWKEEKMKEWNVWAEETRKVMIERLADLWDIATPPRR